MLTCLSPQGIAGKMQGEMLLWMKPIDATKEARFSIEIFDNNGASLARESICWNHSFSSR